MGTDKRYDLVVLGATGFTGQRIAAEVASEFKGRWAVAGRSKPRLEEILSKLAVPTNQDRPTIEVADVSDADALLKLAQSSRIVINTVGPFRQYGMPVVRACIAGGCHYLDVCGEPEFMERVDLELGQAAREAGLFVVSALGFDCVPGDVGAQEAAALFVPPARCTWVESFVSLHCTGNKGFGGNFATYESAVYGFANAPQLTALRRQIAAARGKPRLDIPGPKPKLSSRPVYDERLKRWALPFPAADASVMRRTWAAKAAEGKPAAHTSVSFTLKSRFYLFLFVVLGSAFGWLSKWRLGRYLLLRFPGFFSYGVFSRQGPSEEQIRNTWFEYLHIAHGYSKGAPASPGEQPDEHHAIRIRGPEPGYISCSIFVTQAAYVILEERDKILEKPGVLTPAYLLSGTTYVSRLQSRGISIEAIPVPSK